jgi:hypothetical protein
MIPAGKHSITWKFEPETYVKSSKISLVGSILLSLLSFLAFVSSLKIEFTRNNSK